MLAMIEVLKEGWATHFDSVGAFPLFALGAIAGIEDTTGGYAGLGRWDGLFGGIGLSSTLDDEGT